MGIIDLFKRLRVRRNLTSADQSVSTQPMEHPVLGSLAPDKQFPGNMTGRLKYGVGYIDLHVSPEGETLEAALAFAAMSVQALKQLDSKCRELIADEFLEGYNSTWQFGQTVLDNRTAEPLEKPLLTRAQFCAKPNLEGMDVLGSSMLQFCYGDNEMFGGHYLQVTSFDGVAFGDTNVEMVG